MEFKIIKDSDSKEFKEAWEIYEYSFPSDEKRDLRLQSKIMKEELYHFYSVFEGRVLAAIIADWNLGDFLFIEYIAVRKDSRDKGIGTKMLNEYLRKNRQKIVLEAELPKDKIAKKRIKFFRRIGFKLNRFEYTQPPYSKDKNPVPMLLMTYPDEVNKTEFCSLRKKIYAQVYGQDVD